MLVFNLPGSGRFGRRRTRAAAARRWSACGALCITLLAGGLADAAEGVTSRAAREEAKRAIPFQQLPPEVRAKAWEVVDRPSLFRRMPPKAIECDPELYQFLLRYPEVVVNIWDLMGITEVKMERLGPVSVKASDGAGTECVAHLVHSQPHMHVYYAEGVYEGPLLKNKIHGSCVLLLRSQYSVGPEERAVVLNQLDVFLKVENVGIDLLAKTLHPLVGKSADYNFIESAAFLGKISQAAEANGPGVQRLAANLDKVDVAVRDRFSELAGAVSHRAALRTDDVLQLERPASELVRRAIDEGLTPFGAPADEPAAPASAINPDPPRKGITLRR